MTPASRRGFVVDDSLLMEASRLAGVGLNVPTLPIAGVHRRLDLRDGLLKAERDPSAASWSSGPRVTGGPPKTVSAEGYLDIGRPPLIAPVCRDRTSSSSIPAASSVRAPADFSGLIPRWPFEGETRPGFSFPGEFLVRRPVSDRRTA